MKKISNILIIISLVLSISLTIISYLLNKPSESFAWGNCTLWIMNAMIISNFNFKKKED